MRFVIDRIIDNIVILEEISTKKKIEVNLDLLPVNVRDGSVLKYDNDCYILDSDYEEKRRKKLREKLNRLKNIK